MHDERILITGGTGRLGTALRGLIPGLLAPVRAEMDITKASDVTAALQRYAPTLVVHTAAYTDVTAAECEREACWRANVLGTRHVVQATAAAGVALVHISTDYVFEGTVGDYREDDALGPTRNYYSLTKLVAEEVVRLHPRHLVIRSSFRPSQWPYPVAFDDIYTSQDYIDVIAPQIALCIRNFRKCPLATLHIATERKTPLELARRRNPEVRAGSKRDARVALPDDISLNTARWQELKAAWVE